MRKTRFIQMVVLGCITSLAACTSGEDGTVGNTELNVIVPVGSDLSGPGTSPIDIQSVEYTINCQGTESSFLDDNTPLPGDGAVQINGNLEVVDGRTSPTEGIPPEFGTERPEDRSEIWQGFMDLPVGPCTIQLRARDNDGEVICTATEQFDILPDVTSKVNLVMVCDVSFQAPVGSLDVDATFSFVVGNFCPDLFVINCVDSSPPEVQVLPPPNPAVAGTTCEVRARDVDSTCGESCDPQQCNETPEGLTCTPGDDPGVSTTVTCTDLFIDCEGDGTPNPEGCVFEGDLLGEVGGGPPEFPGGGGDGNFFITCIPPALGGTPGVTGTCTAVTTDGDEDCDKTKVVEIACPGLNFCDENDCDDSNDCTANDCDRNAQACLNTPLDEGTSCNPGTGGPGECDGQGSCSPVGCLEDADCELDGSICTVPPAGACDVQTGQCAPEVPGNEGQSCDSGVGSGDGTCSDGSCDSNDACLVNGDCPDPAGDCILPLCDTGVTPYACGSQNAEVGTPCTEVPNGACTAQGTCEAPPVIAPGDGTTTWRANTTPAGGVPGATGGCTVFVTALNTEIFLQVDITLDVVSDGNNNLTTGWQIIAANFLLPTLGNAAELGGLAIEAAVSNAAIGGGSPGTIASGLTEEATGQLIGAFFNADGQLELNSPTEITEGTGAATPLDGDISVNWDGRFTLDLTLGGAPLVTVTEDVCVFDEVGDPIVFPVN
jgi:hypothetical protein